MRPEQSTLFAKSRRLQMDESIEMSLASLNTYAHLHDANNCVA